MHLQRETNPHLSPSLSPLPSQRPWRPYTQGPALQLDPQSPDLFLLPEYNKSRPHPRLPPRLQPKRRPDDRLPSQPVHTGFKQYPTEDTQSVQRKLHPGQHAQPQQGDQPPHARAGQIWPTQPHGGRHPPGQHSEPQPHASDLRVPTSRKSRPIAWLIAACCTLFWIIIIVCYSTTLIVYLLYHPHLPKFDISNASLNAAYLDMDYLLNADLTLLANFTNPKKKVNVEFNYAIMNLYHGESYLATRYVEPFTAFRGKSKFKTVHMITSQVPLTLSHSQDLRRQMESGRVVFVVKGLFQARSNLGFLSYSYWLYGYCTITMTGPPASVLIGKHCTTKR